MFRRHECDFLTIDLNILDCPESGANFEEFDFGWLFARA